MIKYSRKVGGWWGGVRRKKQRIGMRKADHWQGAQRVHILNSINHRPGVMPRPLPHVESIVFTNKLLQERISELAHESKINTIFFPRKPGGKNQNPPPLKNENFDASKMGGEKKGREILKSRKFDIPFPRICSPRISQRAQPLEPLHVLPCLSSGGELQVLKFGYWIHRHRSSFSIPK